MSKYKPTGRPSNPSRYTFKFDIFKGYRPPKIVRVVKIKKK